MMDLATVDRATTDGAVVVDVRPTIDFAAGHLAKLARHRPRRTLRRAGGQRLGPDTSIILMHGDARRHRRGPRAPRRIDFDRVIGALAPVESVRLRPPQPGPTPMRLTAAFRRAQSRRSANNRHRRRTWSRRGRRSTAPRRPQHPAHPCAPRLATLDPDRSRRSCCAAGRARSAIASGVLLAMASTTCPTSSVGWRRAAYWRQRPHRELGVILALIVLGVAIGLTLGALGAGGSMAVPVLVHVAGLSATAATATSSSPSDRPRRWPRRGHQRNVRLDVALVRPDRRRRHAHRGIGRQAPLGRRAADGVLGADGGRRPPHDGSQTSDPTFAIGAAHNPIADHAPRMRHIDGSHISVGVDSSAWHHTARHRHGGRRGRLPHRPVRRRWRLPSSSRR